MNKFQHGKMVWFMSRTGCSVESEAMSILDSNNWKMQKSIDYYREKNLVVR